MWIRKLETNINSFVNDHVDDKLSIVEKKSEVKKSYQTVKNFN